MRFLYGFVCGLACAVAAALFTDVWIDSVTGMGARR